VQLRGGVRWPHARRTLCTLSVRSRAPTKQMGPYRRSSLAKLDAEVFRDLLVVLRVRQVPAHRDPLLVADAAPSVGEPYRVLAHAPAQPVVARGDGLEDAPRH